jgi:ABC-type transport system involved in cytochrome c biogenesis permease component
MCLATLVLAAGNQNALFALIFMPLMTPVLIFGSSSVLMQQQGLDSTPILLLLLGVALLLLVLGPMLIKKGLALALE